MKGKKASSNKGLLKKGRSLKRKPYAGEKKYFKENPKVAGMATEDGRVIINKHSNLSKTGKKSVIVNEASRVLMDEKKVKPRIRLTKQQKAAFEGTAYAGNKKALKKSIIARIIAKDPSAMATKGQKRRAARIKRKIEK